MQPTRLASPPHNTTTNDGGKMATATDKNIYHYVVSYDENTRKWEVVRNQYDFFEGGSVYGGDPAWMFTPEDGSEEENLDYYHMKRLEDIVKYANIKKVRLAKEEA